MTIDPTDGTIQWIDCTATPGITYQYSIVHVENETKPSALTSELAATVPAPSGTDTTPPELTIIGPIRQHWAAFPRIVLQYADSQSPIQLWERSLADRVLRRGRPRDRGVRRWHRQRL